MTQAPPAQDLHCTMPAALRVHSQGVEGKDLIKNLCFTICPKTLKRYKKKSPLIPRAAQQTAHRITRKSPDSCRCLPAPDDSGEDPHALGPHER